MDDHELRVIVTDEDVRIARRVWLAALDDDTTPAIRVTQLHDDLRRMIHTQAQQIAEAFRAAHRAAADDLRGARAATRLGLPATD